MLTSVYFGLICLYVIMLCVSYSISKQALETLSNAVFVSRSTDETKATDGDVEDK